MKTHGVYSQIYQRIAEDKSLFPSLPEILVRLREELDHPGCTNKSIARFIQVDLALTAFILKTARSARFLSKFTVKTLEDAVRRLGLSDTYSVAMTFFMRSIFNSSNYNLSSDLRGLYFSSVKTSAISYLLAGNIRRINPNRAMLAGLLQDIGAPSILAHLYDRKEIYDDPVARNRALDELCPLVGTLILKSWDFEGDLVDITKSRKDWNRNHDNRADLSDVVLVARYHAMIGTPQFAECPAITDIPAFHKMPEQVLSPIQSMQLVEESREEITSIERLLTGGTA
ncbi:MAG: HDOD domain-containing protein [Candidatus Sedimenticola sp. 20ELBAFRAG]